MARIMRYFYMVAKQILNKEDILLAIQCANNGKIAKIYNTHRNTIQWHFIKLGLDYKKSPQKSHKIL